MVQREALGKRSSAHDEDGGVDIDGQDEVARRRDLSPRFDVLYPASKIENNDGKSDHRQDSRRDPNDSRHFREGRLAWLHRLRFRCVRVLRSHV